MIIRREDRPRPTLSELPGGVVTWFSEPTAATVEDLQPQGLASGSNAGSDTLATEYALRCWIWIDADLGTSEATACRVKQFGTRSRAGHRGSYRCLHDEGWEATATDEGMPPQPPPVLACVYVRALRGVAGTAAAGPWCVRGAVVPCCLCGVVGGTCDVIPLQPRRGCHKHILKWAGATARQPGATRRGHRDRPQGEATGRGNNERPLCWSGLHRTGCGWSHVSLDSSQI